MKSASFLCFLKSVFYTINGVVEARRHEREYTTNDENLSSLPLSSSLKLRQSQVQRGGNIYPVEKGQKAY
jgi:hypothetical protein